MNPITIIHTMGEKSQVVPVKMTILHSREIFIHEYYDLEGGVKIPGDHLMASAYAPLKSGFCNIGVPWEYWNIEDPDEAIVICKLVILKYGKDKFLRLTEPLDIPSIEEQKKMKLEMDKKIRQ